MDNFIEFLYSKFLQSDGVSIDTRSIGQDNLFFALKGPNFNGNKYAPQALEKGAAFAVVDEIEFVTDPRIILSPISCLDALQQLAIFHRSRFKRKVLAITGSNGKTTTKEIMARVLAEKYIVHATKGNLNNHLGVPLTILDIYPQVEIAIIEMGANHVGEIAALCQIANPGYGLITNIGEAHTETFGGIEGVLRGKSELFDYLRKTGGTPFINTMDHRLENMTKRFEEPILFPENDLKLLEANPYIIFELSGKRVETNLVGAYNFGNVSAAVAVGRAFAVDDDQICQAIASYKPDNQRSEIIVKGSIVIINDCYNANPTSMNAALDNLKLISGKKTVILGDMKEVQDSEIKHRELGKRVKEMNPQQVIFIGSEMKNAQLEVPNSKWFDNVSDFLGVLDQFSFEANTVLIKGSRSGKLDLIEGKLGEL
ncbi:MAG: UDP-N-acetylmuramoyl-tripeptide--D-alanyl-D-alanine ligase [Cyclobacteriaceae bacterium]|jgi:UDP-N-acetylmuramoyl-tripeptide--D-alanyl-D-alanine ligase